VQRVLHTLSANHGFDVTVPVPGGSHTVCAYGVSLNGADRLALGCKTVVVPVNPRGNLESLTATGGGNFQVRGWTFDPDANGGPARLQVNVDSRIYRFPVALSRPDVQRYYGLANAAVGFNASVPVGKGIHRVCAYGINIAGAGVNVPLRCITVTG